MLRGVPVTAVTAILKLWPTASAYGVLNVVVPSVLVTDTPASPLMLLLELQFVSFGFVLEQSRTATVAVPVLSQYRAATTLNGLFTNTGAMKLSSPLASATGSTRKHLNELPWEPVGPVSPCGPVGPWRPSRPSAPAGPVGARAPRRAGLPRRPRGPRRARRAGLAARPCRTRRAGRALRALGAGRTLRALRTRGPRRPLGTCAVRRRA